MKLLLPLVCSLLVVTSSQSLAADKAPAKKAEPAKAVEEPQIKGVVVPRAAGGYLAVEIVNSTFKLSFYDAKKQPVPPDVARALLRWDPKTKVGQERVVLNPSGDGLSLGTGKPVRPPYAFKLFITLIKEAKESEEPVGETYTIDFRA